MKKLIIIFTLIVFPLFGWGQYQLPDTLWNGTINVVGSDTLLYDSVNATNTGIKLIKYTGSLNNIDLTEYGFLIIDSDTIPLSFYRQIGSRNYNDADTLFAQTSGNYLTRLARYSTPTADINNYWQALTITASMILVPSEQATIQAAITASTNDTIIVSSGTYLETWSGTTALYSNTRTATIICNGLVILQKAAQTYTILFNNGNIKCYGLSIDGNNSGINVNLSATNHLLDACYIYNNGTNPIRIDNSTINNSIIDATVTVAYIFINDDGARFLNNYIKFGNQTSCIRPNALKTGGITFNYNKVIFDSPTFGINLQNNGNDTIIYNDISGTLISSFIAQVDTGLSGTRIIENNYFHPDSVRQGLGTGFVYLRDSYQMKVYAKNNRIKIDSGICSGYTLYGLDSTSISNDTIDVKYLRQAIDISKSHAGGYQGENYIMCRYSISTGTGFLIKITGDTLKSDNIYITEKNEIFAPNYFDESRTGIHACIFSGAVNHNIRYNYLNGSNDVGNIVLKAEEISTYNMRVYGNVIINGTTLIKGYPFVEYYNNTTYNSKNSALTIVDDLDVVGEESYSTDCDIKNNIFYSNVDDGSLISFTGDSVFQRLSFNYNVLFDDDTIVKIDGIKYTFAEWQGLGYDANSYNTNPNFTSSTQLWPKYPSDAIGNGLNLGSTYQSGLNISSVWPDSVVLRNQSSVDWSIGAYVVDLDNIGVVNGKVVVINGKLFIFK